MRKSIINFFKFLLFFGVGFGILYLVYQNQNKAYQEDCVLKGVPAEECSLLIKVISDFGTVNYFWIVMVLIAFLFSNISRSIRWNMLLGSLGYQPRLINALLTTILGYFANLGLPRVGEVVRGGTMAQYEGIDVEKVMGTIVVDRIVDVICILIITGLSILLQYQTIGSYLSENVDLSSRFSGGGNLLFILGGIFLGIVGLVYIFRARLKQSKFYEKVKKIAQGFWQGILTVKKLKNPGLFLFHTVNIWLMYYLMTYLCFLAFPPTAHLGLMAALVVFVFGGWGIVIPSPGGMGTYHFLAQTALMIYGISGDDGFSWANISFFSIQLGCNISVGLLSLVILPIINRNYKPIMPD